MSWLATVALLCQISVATGSNWSKDSDRLQLDCQQELIKCLRKDIVNWTDTDKVLADCVLKRKAN